MTNNVKSQSKNRWTNSDLSSLTLWIVFITSINKLNDNFYSARAFLCDTKLSESMGILNSEFTNIEACFRWFSELPNNFFAKLN